MFLWYNVTGKLLSRSLFFINIYPFPLNINFLGFLALPNLGHLFGVKSQPTCILATRNHVLPTQNRPHGWPEYTQTSQNDFLARQTGAQACILTIQSGAQS